MRAKCTAVAQGSYVFAMFTFAPATTSNFATSKRPFSAEKLMAKLPFPCTPVPEKTFKKSGPQAAASSAQFTAAAHHPLCPTGAAAAASEYRN